MFAGKQCLAVRKIPFYLTLLWNGLHRYQVFLLNETIFCLGTNLPVHQSYRKRDSDLSLYIYIQSVYLQNLGWKTSIFRQSYWCRQCQSPNGSWLLTIFCLMNTDYFFPSYQLWMSQVFFGLMQLIRPRKLAALWSFSLYYTVAKKSAVSLLSPVSLWGCSPTAGTVHRVLFCLLMRHASAKWFTLWLESNSLIKMQLFNKAEMKHLDFMKTERFAILHGGV